MTPPSFATPYSIRLKSEYWWKKVTWWKAEYPEDYDRPKPRKVKDDIQDFVYHVLLTMLEPFCYCRGLHSRNSDMELLTFIPNPRKVSWQLRFAWGKTRSHAMNKILGITTAGFNLFDNLQSNSSKVIFCIRGDHGQIICRINVIIVVVWIKSTNVVTLVSSSSSSLTTGFCKVASENKLLFPGECCVVKCRMRVIFFRRNRHGLAISSSTWSPNNSRKDLWSETTTRLLHPCVKYLVCSNDLTMIRSSPSTEAYLTAVWWQNCATAGFLEKVEAFPGLVGGMCGSRDQIFLFPSWLKQSQVP